ncbi:MAG: tetratricopeptide repeat protein [Bacteroidales bacterium]|nr:tetratricopeptide repeat protein [Bacteroidales bacterium]MDT8373557.1 tetratricopeptide repeat protein [Bacteroidales bacterium]
MSSLIPGYNYDIFISYRQKDNKYDGWVTEFVSHLQSEIEATFKEDVSVYFDENPHDGLLEIHDVNKSLEGKLKSLIFIPIISQTYCDPKSFAWQQEFCVFNGMTREDQHGRDIKLASGNVCSRIIPVKIHEIDAIDTELIETELGCRLRSIDFIYSSSGVNRPLTPLDNPEKNLNRTFYRDQINKVANAVKEVIYAVHPDERKRATKPYQSRTRAGFPDEKVSPLYETKRTPRNYIETAIFSILIIMALAFVITKLMDKTGGKLPPDEEVRKAIAIMPVSNFTGNPDLAWIADMIQSDLTGQLQGISHLTVRPKQTTMQFRNSEEPIQEIAKKLSVNNLVESSIKGTEDNIQVEIMVVEAFPVDKYIYRSSFALNFENLGKIYSEITDRILKGIEVRTTEREEEVLTARITVNPEVRKACARGRYYMSQLTLEGVELGMQYYKEAIAIDPADPEPCIGLAVGYVSAGHGAGISPDGPEMAKAYALKAIELDPEELHPDLADAHVVLAERYLYTEWDFEKAEYHLRKATELNPSSTTAHYTYGWYFALLDRIDDGADMMRKAIEIDPLNPICPGYLGWLYVWVGRNEEALAAAEQTLTVFPDYNMAHFVKGLACSNMGRHEDAIEIQQNIYNPRSGFASGLAIAYARAGKRELALEIAAEMEKQNLSWHTWGLAEVYAALGDNDKSIYYLEEAIRLRHDFMPWIRYNYNLRPLKDDQRFQDLIRGMNLPG